MAMLIGPDAPLALDPSWHAVHSAHSYDFYKPAGGGLYPTVDGPSSVSVYLAAVESCAAQLRHRLQQQAAAVAAAAGAAAAACHNASAGRKQQQGQQQEQQQEQEQWQEQQQQQREQLCLSAQVHHFLAHAPFHRMVRKALARLLLGDALACSR